MHLKNYCYIIENHQPEHANDKFPDKIIKILC